MTAFASCGKKAPSPPNIVLIVADDLGWKDLGFMGSSYYETPNLDHLADEGMVFRRAYAAAANCAPSRACPYSPHCWICLEGKLPEIWTGSLSGPF